MRAVFTKYAISARRRRRSRRVFLLSQTLVLGVSATREALGSSTMVIGSGSGRGIHSLPWWCARVAIYFST
jgi:hypothetical protein